MGEYSPKYGIPARCLSVCGPCEKMCAQCLSSPDEYLEKETRRDVARCIVTLRTLGYKVEQTDKVFDFLKDMK
jgi:hypothetical protein